MASFFEKLKGISATQEEKEILKGLKEDSKERKIKTLEKELKTKKEENFEELVEQDGELAVDVYQTDSEIIIKSTIAGVKPDDLEIAIENDVLTIKGKREDEIKEEGRNYFYQECYWGNFSRQIILPEEVDPNRIDAGMKNGILTIKLPKINRSKLRKISVKNEEKKKKTEESEE